jgi:LDH2 family malate/lactate/ureidoglycolate dehydrogenase
MSAFPPDRLRRFAAGVYRRLGVGAADAALIADSLVQADLWGHQSHGVMRTFWYAERMRSGATRVDAAPEIVLDCGALAVVDGCDGIGQVVADFAMRQAIERARAHGVGLVSVRSSGHFGTLMFFTRRAALAGCVGMLTTNASPAMAPWGGRGKLVGNNPWSIAAPAGRHPPMMLDVANTAVARGKLYLALKRGEPIPLGWASDAEGRPTTDPAAGIAGDILPFGGHKGYAVSVLMDVLSGVLSGSGFGPEIIGPYKPDGRSRVGHLALAIDIAPIRPLAAFESDMERMIEGLKAAPRAADVAEIFYPGEPEARAEARQTATGVALPEETVAELERGAAEIGAPSLSEA